MHLMMLRLVVPIALIVTVCGCTSGGQSGSKISRVVVASSFNAPSGALNQPLPTFHTSPACKLLTESEVASALGKGTYAPNGNKSHFYGAAKIPMDIDICSWQKTIGGQPADSVQVEVDTASTESDAVAEYRAFVELTHEHADPGRLPESISGIGSQASLLSGWLIAQKGTKVLAVTGLKIKDVATLRRLAREAAHALHW